MKFLIPIAVIPEIDEIFRNLKKVADNEGGINECKWYYCNFNNTCGPNISQHLYDFMYRKLDSICGDDSDSFSCDQCDGTYNS